MQSPALQIFWFQSCWFTDMSGAASCFVKKFIVGDYFSKGTDSPSQVFEMIFREKKSAGILGFIPHPHSPLHLSEEPCGGSGLIAAWESKLVFTINNGADFVAIVSDNTCAESVTVLHANS